MPIDDKIGAAKRIDALLRTILTAAQLRLRYRITVDPPLPEERDWERPIILVEFSGTDAEVLLERNAELLRALEHVAQEMLRLGPDEHEKVSFDALGHRAMRIEELRLAARVAAERVRKTGAPYTFSPMSSRERRIIHLALRDESDLKTESQGYAGQRCVVVYPKDYRSSGGAKSRTGGGVFSTRRGRR
jgi:spoIIIJ-associated protein